MYENIYIFICRSWCSQKNQFNSLVEEINKAIGGNTFIDKIHFQTSVKRQPGLTGSVHTYTHSLKPYVTPIVLISQGFTKRCKQRHTLHTFLPTKELFYAFDKIIVNSIPILISYPPTPYQFPSPVLESQTFSTKAQCKLNETTYMYLMIKQFLLSDYLFLALPLHQSEQL